MREESPRQQILDALEVLSDIRHGLNVTKENLQLAEAILDRQMYRLEGMLEEASKAPYHPPNL